MLKVVFDMDGVIFDTEALCRRAWRTCNEKYGIPDVDGLLALCIGVNAKRTLETFDAVMGKDFPTQEFLNDSRALVRKIREEEGIPVKKGAREILTFLKEQNASVGLASSTAFDTVVRQLRGAGFLEFFQVIVGGDQINRSKPDPEIYQRACRELGVEPGSTYAVEDSYNGVHAACNAGMKTIMVPDLLPPTEEMEHIAYRILPDLTAVRDFLRDEKCA